MGDGEAEQLCNLCYSTSNNLMRSASITQTKSSFRFLTTIMALVVNK